MRSSPFRIQKFKVCAEKEKIEWKKKLLALDVTTRWSSTYLMLESTCYFEKAIDRMDGEDNEYVSYFRGFSCTPRAIDWEKAHVFVRILRLFMMSHSSIVNL